MRGFCDIGINFQRLDLGNVNQPCDTDYIAVGAEKLCGDFTSLTVTGQLHSHYMKYWITLLILAHKILLLLLLYCERYMSQCSVLNSVYCMSFFSVFHRQPTLQAPSTCRWFQTTTTTTWKKDLQPLTWWCPASAYTRLYPQPLPVYPTQPNPTKMLSAIIITISSFTPLPLILSSS